MGAARKLGPILTARETFDGGARRRPAAHGGYAPDPIREIENAQFRNPNRKSRKREKGKRSEPNAFFRGR